MQSLGIAIATYDRRESLARLVEAVRKLTNSPYELVIADDGSDDGTADWCASNEVRIVRGPNRGVAWNKNRGLFALSWLGCDPLILVEDDVYPVTEAWDREWVQATRRWHHAAFLHPKLAGSVLAGAGTAKDPFVNPKSSAQCVSVSAEALGRVGFFDSRFTGWGHEHAEWTMRIKQAGYGHREVLLPDGIAVSGLVYISGGLVADDAPSYRDERQAAVNLSVFRKVLRDPPFRYPWASQDERSVFLGEQAQAGFSAAPGRATVS